MGCRTVRPWLCRDLRSEPTWLAASHEASHASEEDTWPVIAIRSASIVDHQPIAIVMIRGVTSWRRSPLGRWTGQRTPSQWDGGPRSGRGQSRRPSSMNRAMGLVRCVLSHAVPDHRLTRAPVGRPVNIFLPDHTMRSGPPRPSNDGRDRRPRKATADPEGYPFPRSLANEATEPPQVA